MAEKVNLLKLERDYTKYLYFIDAAGNVCRRTKGKNGVAEVVVPNAVQRDKDYMYYVDKEGDVARTLRAALRNKASA